MFDEVFIKILSETKEGTWISITKLYEILHDYFPEKNNAEQVMDFLKKYFIDINNDRNLVRLNDWATRLFENLHF